MQRTDIPLNFGGQVSYTKFTLTFADLQATSGAGAKAIALVNSPGGSAFQIPQAGKVIGVFAKHSVAFAGGSLSAMTVSLGGVGVSATLFTSAFNIFAAVADTTMQETAMFKTGQLSALALNATFTPTGDTCANCTAGSVDLYVAWLNVTMPSA